RPAHPLQPAQCAAQRWRPAPPAGARARPDRAGTARHRLLRRRRPAPAGRTGPRRRPAPAAAGRPGQQRRRRTAVGQYRLPPAPGRGHYNSGPTPGRIPRRAPAMSHASARHYSPLDRLLIEVQHALDTSFGKAHAERPNPAGELPEVEMDDAARRHAAGLMRINHTGEVCAQALYLGQAAVARDPDTREHLLDAAQEETDHLAWCADRLDELES